MTDDPQPIQTTAAVAHLRHIARIQNAFVHADDRTTPTEGLIADLIEWQQRRIDALESMFAAAPPTLRLPEPMTDAEVFAAMDWYEVEGYDIARWAETETLRRVREANK